jgi:hypothetical protein
MKKFDRTLASRYPADEPINLKNKRSYRTSSIRFKWNDIYIVKNSNYPGWSLTLDDIIGQYTTKSFRDYIFDFIEQYNKFSNFLKLPYQSIVNNSVKIEVIYSGKKFTDFKRPSMIKVKWGSNFFHIIHFDNDYSFYEQYQGEDRQRKGEVYIHHPVNKTVDAFSAMLFNNKELIPLQYYTHSDIAPMDYASLVTLVEMIYY